jgi:membrane-bound metal-dependent hydrolase YbcI (DUF457 family)
VDNLTHTMFGATLARTPLGRAGRGATVALIIASNAPDIDFIAAAGGASKYLQWHRGVTHGPLGITGLAVLTASLIVAARRLNPKWRHPDDAPFAMLVAVSFVGTLVHVLMDLPTSYGTRLLSPFSWRWFSVDWMPIVDVYLVVLLAAGLFFGRASASARRRNAAIVLAFTAAIYGVRAAAHRQALDVAPRLYGPTLPPRCDPRPEPPTWVESWPKPKTTPSLPQTGQRCLVELAAVPTFTSPFDWRIVAQMSNAFELREVNVLDNRLREANDESNGSWRRAIRYPNVWTPAVQQAAATDVGRAFLGFSRFPAARTATDASGSATVRFTDVRFVLGPGIADQPAPPVQIFTATIRLDAQGRIVSERLGR